MNLDIINAWNIAEAREAFRRCCGSSRWAREMEIVRPFGSEKRYEKLPTKSGGGLSPSTGSKRLRHTRDRDPRQAGARACRDRGLVERGAVGAGDGPVSVLATIAEKNRRYKARFGYIFIVCATGKSAEEMLANLESRLNNSPDDEIRCAAAEQAKITQNPSGENRAMSPITSHVLDTTSGKPAQGIAVVLEIADGLDRWSELAERSPIRPGESRLSRHRLTP